MAKSQDTNLVSFDVLKTFCLETKMPGSKTPRFQRLLHVGLDVAIMALIIISFLWGGATSRSEPVYFSQTANSTTDIYARNE